MRRIHPGLWLLALLLCLPPAACGDTPRVPNGRRWGYMIPEQKLYWISGSFALARESGMVIKHDPLFYLVLLNAYYADAANADVDLGNALADIALPIGAFEFVESAAKP